MRGGWALTLVILAACDARSGAPPPRAQASATQAPPAAPANEKIRTTRADATATLCRTLADRDRDCDRRLTRDDQVQLRSAFPYAVELGGKKVELRSLPEAAQFVQELVVALERDRQSDDVQLELDRVRANPVDYLSYRIEHYFWDALTRRIDAEPAALARALNDPKLSAPDLASTEYCPTDRARCAAEPPAPPAPRPKLGVQHLYVPADDAQALSVFSAAAAPGRLAVHALPERVTAAWFTQTTKRGEHGLLTLALDADGRGRPFVVPGGRFNEMYGWDSFFILWGLTQSPAHTELARAIVDNQAYEIRHYGKILNANRSYYLTRSQPPFFTSSIAAVLGRSAPGEQTTRWLAGVLEAAIHEYDRVWNAPPRRVSLCEGETCLARYFGEGTGEPPEVELGHFTWFYQQHAVAHGHCPGPGDDRASRERFLACSERLAQHYRSGKLRDPAIDDFFSNDRCVRESGHDTTYRWFDAGSERCASFAPVELNALLFKYEIDIAGFIARSFEGRFLGRTSAEFCDRARARARLMEQHHWDDAAGLFFDYDLARKQRSSYVAATTLIPLWASAPNVCGATLVSPERARKLRDAALPQLEVAGGLLASSQRSLVRIVVPRTLVKDGAGALSYRRGERQWEAPNGWAPHQMLAWVGLRQFGFELDARRLAYRWLGTIVENAANYHGTVPEKFDVVQRSHRVFQEYGNVNTDFSYIASEGFGWMNASFVVGLALLEPTERRALAERRQVERVFSR